VREALIWSAMVAAFLLGLYVLKHTGEEPPLLVHAKYEAAPLLLFSPCPLAPSNIPPPKKRINHT
jgi:hypothetical protein